MNTIHDYVASLLFPETLCGFVVGPEVVVGAQTEGEA